MIKQIYFLFFTVLTFNFAVKAQDNEQLKGYNWNEQPNYTQYNNDSEEIIGVKDKQIVDFEYDDVGRLVLYKLLHKAYILNSDEQIENYNKLYLPYTSSEEDLKVIQARVIKKNGDIIKLDKNKLLTAKDEESGREYKYYAFEGVDKGSVIEYFYIIKTSVECSGTKESPQKTFTNNNYSFDLYAPNNLIFKTKSYNALAPVILDTAVLDKNRWFLNIDKVDKLETEIISAYHANKQFLIYKLDKNKANNRYEISSYSKTAKNIYANLYTPLSKSILNKVKKMMSNTSYKKESTDLQKIRRIEDYIKANIYTVDYNTNELSDIQKILITKTASHTGIMKLFIAVFKILEVNAQVVLTSNRMNLKFDKDFEASNFLNEYLFYFPKEKTYMSPTSIVSRIGFPSSNFTNNYGLFIKEVNINNFKTAVAKIKFIKPLDYTKSYDNISAVVKLNENDIKKSLVNYVRKIGGYTAMNIQPLMNLYKEEDKKEIIDDYVKYLTDDMTVLKQEITYDDAKYFGIEPLTAKFDFHLDPFIESAGEQYILKIGKLIGPQSEMYQEKKRVLPIENNNTRSYHRLIKIELPSNYEIKNLDDININYQHKNSETQEMIMGFKSSYVLENNILTITVDEYYSLIEVPLELFESYRKIINSAADFNNVSLLVEKK